MLISSVDLFRGELPFHAPFRISLSESSGTENLFLRVTTDTGLVGWGEASPSPVITGDTADGMCAVWTRLARTILGRDPRDVRGAHDVMQAAMAGQTTLRSAFDMALHDLAARAAGLPLCVWFGGAPRSFTTDNTVSLDTPDAMAEQARAFVGQGFRAIKAKVGTDVASDEARIRALRQAIGPHIPLRIDANQAWSVQQAVTLLSNTRDCGLEYCEQPVRRGDTAGMAEVRRRSSVPVMADESVFDHYDALELIRADACDYLNIKLSKSGGLVTAGRIAAVAHAAGTACMLGCMSETRLGLTAAAHFIAAHPIVRFADLDSHVDHTFDPVRGGITIRGGEVHLPEGPGLGSDLDPAFLERCRHERVQA